MTRSLNGKVAVITGAGSGMGRSMALRLAEDNAKIAIWDINGAGAEETACPTGDHAQLRLVGGDLGVLAAIGRLADHDQGVAVSEVVGQLAEAVRVQVAGFGVGDVGLDQEAGQGSGFAVLSADRCFEEQDVAHT